jgi:hypothetical protein
VGLVELLESVRSWADCGVLKNRDAVEESKMARPIYARFQENNLLSPSYHYSISISVTDLLQAVAFLSS